MPGQVREAGAGEQKGQPSQSAVPRQPVASSQIEALLSRMQRGDREAAAEFITRYGARVRRRVRGKLPPSMRRLFDSQEILSTVGRRLDRYVRSGKLDLLAEGQLWALVFRLADNAVIEKARLFRRLDRIEGEDGPFARILLDRLHRAERAAGAELEIDAALHELASETDREILSQWLLGRSHAETAMRLGCAPTAVRKRWQRIKHRLREHLRPEVAT